MRIAAAPKIKNLDLRYQSAPRQRVLSYDEMAAIAWYAWHNADLFRFVALQFATAIRPAAALKFNPVEQYDDQTGFIDQQPSAHEHNQKE